MRVGRLVDASSLAAFRVFFGTMMLLGVARFAAKGWIEELYLRPTFRFHFDGFAWVEPWPVWGLPPWTLYLHFALMGVAALAIALGLFYRIAAGVFFVLFTYVELLDKTTYLNHYYLVSLISFLLIFLPLHRCFSLDAWRRPSRRSRVVPLWVLGTLRMQLGLVYVFAGLAKLKPDWLVRGEPLATWLHTYAHLPAIGPILARPEVALAMSWTGALFDLGVVPCLLWKRTRLYAYFVLVVFHALTGALFYIGLFPWVMIVLTTLFLDPAWPRVLLHRAASMLAPGEARPVRLGPGMRRRYLPTRLPTALLLTLYFVPQVLLPLRQHFYPGNPCWTELGYRFAWNVMLMEKTGHVEYRAVVEGLDRTLRVHPRDELTTFQVRMMSTQPDMIVEYAQHIGRRLGRRFGRRVQVYADAYASLNGRTSRRLIDPSADLTRVRDLPAVISDG